jgi:hypothetical protein
MSMKACRKLASALAALTIINGLVCKLFPGLNAAVIGILSVCAILLACSCVFIIIRFHRCPKCHKFIPITLRPDTCLHCNADLN